jgi:hypothetical protein
LIVPLLALAAPLAAFVIVVLILWLAIRLHPAFASANSSRRCGEMIAQRAVAGGSIRWYHLGSS